MNTHHKQLIKTLEKIEVALAFLTRRQIQILTTFQEEVLCYVIDKYWDGESEVAVEELYVIATSKAPPPTFTLPHQQFNSGGK